MNWETWRDENKLGWNSRVPVHVGPNGYDRQRYLDDPTCVSGVIEFDRPRMNGGLPLVGLDVVHLQCHIGTDTLSLLRCGAKSVTGLDFSPDALDEARWLFDQVESEGTFVETDVFDAVSALGRSYDFVYASVGAINWIHDIGQWMKVAADLLKPGGYLYLRDVHPFYMSLDPYAETTPGVLPPVRFDYFEVAEPVTMQDDQTYTGDGTAIAYTTRHEWGHGIADIIQGALKAGLSVDNFWEDDHSDWQALPQMTADDKGIYRLPSTLPRIPFYFTLQATKRT